MNVAQLEKKLAEALKVCHGLQNDRAKLLSQCQEATEKAVGISAELLVARQVEAMGETQRAAMQKVADAGGLKPTGGVGNPGS